MQPLTEFLLRNSGRFRTGHSTLFFNPPGDLPWRDFESGNAGLRLFTQDYAAWKQLDASGAPVIFGTFPAPDATRPVNVVLALPREKERLKMLLHWCSSVLPATGRLWLAGENRAGIRSAGKYLDTYFGCTRKQDTARHCALYGASGPSAPNPFDTDDYVHGWSLPPGRATLELLSFPGVFSHERLDAGTRLLLDVLGTRPCSGSALDFGCGCGVIGLYIKALNADVDLTLMDSDALALLSARRSLDRNGLQAEVLSSDGFSQVSRKFDLVVSNPPFHAGHRADTELGMRLLAPVRNFLNPGGQLLLVANRHLPYRKWMDGLFGNHEVAAANDQYQVLNAVQS